jgi:hypothetical protein
MIGFLLWLEWIGWRSAASDHGNAFDVVAGLKTVGAGSGVSVHDEKGNQTFGQADLPANHLQGLPFAIRQLDPALIVEKPQTVWFQQSDRS